MNHEEWIQHVERMKDMYPLRYDKTQLTGPFIMETIDELTKATPLSVLRLASTRCGLHSTTNTESREPFLLPAELAPWLWPGASIGAKMACGDMGHPDTPVFNIAGDGCFRMNMNEIATATRYNIPIIQVVVNNHVLGMVRQWQNLFYGKRYSHTVLNDAVDFVKLAEAMGAKAYRVTRQEDLKPVLEEAIALKAPVLIECQINCDDKVYPMVSPGAPIQDAFDDTDLKIK